MAFCPLSAKPLPEPILTFCQLDPQEQTFATFESKYVVYIKKCDVEYFHIMEKLTNIVLTHWGLVMPYGDRDPWVNIGSGNGLLPGGTKPLPEPMLTNH